MSESSTPVLTLEQPDGSSPPVSERRWSDGQLAYELRPGQKLRLRCTDWTSRRYLVSDAHCLGSGHGRFLLRFFHRGETTPRFTISMGCMPDLPWRVLFDMHWLDGQKLFCPRTPGRLKATTFGGRADRDQIDYVEIDSTHASEPGPILLSAWRFQDEMPTFPVPDKIVVDDLGQWAEREWPGKTRSEPEMGARLRSEMEQAAPSNPTHWSRFGGSLDHRFRATGFFRTEHDGHRWWLVDPEGFGFWSIGMDCVRPGVGAAIVPGTEKLYQWLPMDDPRFAAAVTRKGWWNLPTFDFGLSNLIRVYGNEWERPWQELTARRLRQWRFNTVANWSAEEMARRGGIPYTLLMPQYPTTKVKLFRDLPDVFDPAFAKGAEPYAEHLRMHRDDPLIVGYFLANEPEWGFGKFNLAAELLEINPGTHTRRELAPFMADRYGNDAGRWSTAWSLPPTRFDQLVTDSFHRVAERSATAAEDCWAFSARIVREFVRIPCEVCRKVDPNHLNLGLRYATIQSEILYEAAEYFDVFSFNHYQYEPKQDVISEIARRTKKPVLIGEFHFGAVDAGLPAHGLRKVATQHERGVAYRRYIELCAANPTLVGAHYFCLYDQNVLGRSDGENYQIGFVDTCHKPYDQIIAAAIESHERIYRVRDGSAKVYEGRIPETAQMTW